MSRQKVGTKEFADAVIARMGKKPEQLKPVSYVKGSTAPKAQAATVRPPAKKETIGVDVFIQWNQRDANALAQILKKVDGDGLRLKMISNRGQRVWPEGLPETFCVDHWRCRYTAPEEGKSVSHVQIAHLLERISGLGLDFIKTENLCMFDGERAYSTDQGE